MAKPPARKTLTELEGAALAIIKRRGPCTAYVVKEAFRTSPSEFWSGSAGAVYPLMKRLEGRKLISSKADKSDGRARREFSVTKSGDTALTEWLTDAGRASSLGFDPLRTRLFFSDLLPDGVLRKFVEAVQQEMEAKTEPPAEDLDHTHALHEQWMKLRLKALKAFVNSMEK